MNFSPVARRWQLAAQLKQLRERAGRSAGDAAAELMCSPAKISRIENASRAIQLRDVRDLCRYYGASDEVLARLLKLADEAQAEGWWQNLATLDEPVSTFVGLESAAISIRDSSAVIPDLCQTAEYTRALHAGTRLAEEVDDQWLAETVQAHSKRRERLVGGELALHSVIDEIAVRRQIGSTATMLSQIESLLKDAQLSNVQIQIIPFTAGATPITNATFQILQFPTETMSHVIYGGGPFGTFFIDTPADVARYARVFEYTSRVSALSPQSTLNWLKDLLQTMTSGPH